jgi:hypothetical protein
MSVPVPPSRNLPKNWNYWIELTAPQARINS